MLFNLAKTHLPNFLLVIWGTFKKNRMGLIISEADGPTVAVVNHNEILEIQEGVDGSYVPESEPGAATCVAEGGRALLFRSAIWV